MAILLAMSVAGSDELLEQARIAARTQRRFVITTHTLPRQTESQIEAVLGIFLDELGQKGLTDSLAYCLRELAVNGKKANTKRVYFQERGFDLLNDDDYQAGMEKFKQDTLDDIDHWLHLQEAAGLYIKVSFHIKGHKLHIQVANNTHITRKEQIRIYDRIARARAFESLEDAITSVLDDSEGAGLGIVIMVLMLRKLGLNEDSFDIDIEDTETVARLVIPMDRVRADSLGTISTELSNHIESLPQFSESIRELSQKLDDPEVEMSEIALILGKDPSLTADLLKTVNSARFMLPRRMDNVFEAVKLVGTCGLRQMMYSYGTQHILDAKDNKYTRRLWSHAQHTAFYAYGIARYVMKRTDIVDDCYVGGILHDMGKIVFSNLHPNIAEKVDRFSRSKGISPDLLKQMADGIDHAEVGARLAEKWNFPDILVTIIRYHHVPLQAAPQYQEVVSVVHIANEFSNLGANTLDHVDGRILHILGLTSRDQLTTVYERLSAQYDHKPLMEDVR